ncbi:MAG: ShlB/FhaC/HecB family hemolysin secretion/activation protein [Goleter apudmare HA4340-LM2]|jgi:hemolysin activation/secretion protein|nr:ShlB/FhaC/HecB family hemolysin secretion/activation protein [Goleter apudmare HA4340-LM2]
MFDKYVYQLATSCFPLSMFVLFVSINFTHVQAQASDILQVPNSSQLPPPQDLQPPAPRTIPSPQPPQPLPSPTDLIPFPESNFIPEQLTPDHLPQTITVEKFEVVGSTVFTPEELAQVTADLINRPISLVELFQARTRITDFYVQRGYITSGAYIPPQTIQSGVIKIQVVEGKLQDIQVTGNQRLNSNYLRSRLALATSSPLNREQLLEALQLLQLNPLIKNLSAELSAGSRSGESVLEVKIQEEKSFITQAVLDNGRSPSVGTFRRRLQLTESNLLGLGDGLSFAYINTDGSNGFDASYTLPLNPRNGTLTFSLSTTFSYITERPFNILDIQSASRYYDLIFRQPVYQTPTQEFTLGLMASRRENEASYIEEDRIPFPSLGSDAEGRTRVSALRFFQEWTTRSTREVIALRSQFSLGIGAFDATINSDLPDSRFFSWQGQAQWVRLLAPDTLLLLRANAQLADQSLLPLEKFGLGGLESVRGYRQDFLIADNVTFASVEVLVPILRLPEIDGLLQVTPFVDFGVAWNNSGMNNPGPNTLTSIGLGLRWMQGDRFTARLDWGIPLISVDSQPKTLQENGLYFSILYNPF